uniref:Uncharacterized protein n=1 Tax=Octopus bimaculoides TaxID=37653 RepID=A0A0L8HER0_OCTBM
MNYQQPNKIQEISMPATKKKPTSRKTKEKKQFQKLYNKTFKIKNGKKKIK